MKRFLLNPPSIYNGTAIGLLACMFLGILLVLIGFSGCVTTFTPSGQLQIGRAPSTNETAEVLADFEASEDSAVAGDITSKSASSCAGGVCTIY